MIMASRKFKFWKTRSNALQELSLPTVLKHEPYHKPHYTPQVHVMDDCACCGTTISEFGDTKAIAEAALVQRRRIGGGPTLCDTCLDAGVRKYNLESEKKKRGVK